MPASTTDGLPLTGARRYPTPASSAARATFAEAFTDTVLMSINAETRAGRGQQPLVAGRDGEQRAVVGDHRDARVRRLPHRLHRPGEGGAARDELFGPARRAVVHRHVVAALEQPGRDRLPHATESDDSDPHLQQR